MARRLAAGATVPHGVLVALVSLWLSACRRGAECGLAKHALHPELEQGPESDGGQPRPGVKVYITRRGMNYLTAATARVLQDNVKQMPIGDIEQEVGPPATGTLTLSNVRIADYKRARRFDVALRQPDIIEWTVDGVDLSIESDLGGQVFYIIPVALTGKMIFTAKGMNVSVTSRVRRRGDTVQFDIERCNVTLDGFTVRMSDAGLSALAGVVPNSKDAMEQFGRATLRSQLCDAAVGSVWRQLNEQIGAMPTRVPLESVTKSLFGGRERSVDDAWDEAVDDGDDVKRSETMKRLAETTKLLYVDYGLVGKPELSEFGMMLPGRGEVYGVDYTPFGAPSIDDRQLFDPDANMLYVSFSDYVINTLLFQAYASGVMQLTLNKHHQEPMVRHFMRTTCNEGFDICLGDLMPHVAAHFPDRYLDIRLFVNRAPYVRFSRQSNAAKLDLRGDMLIYVMDKDSNRIEHALTSAVGIDAHIPLVIVGDTSPSLDARIGVDRLRIAVAKSSVPGVDAGDRLKSLENWAWPLVEQLLAGIVSGELPLPEPSGVRLDMPKLYVIDRAVVFAADLEVRQENIETMTQMAFQRPAGDSPLSDEDNAAPDSPFSLLSDVT